MVYCNSLQVITYMVLAIISASLAGLMFCVSMPGIFVGGGEDRPPSVSYLILYCLLV